VGRVVSYISKRGLVIGKGEHLPLSLQARILWVRARVPIYRLFLTIFLWFWVTAWGMLAIVFLVNDLKGVREVSAPSMYATIAPILAAEAAKTYESGGRKHSLVFRKAMLLITNGNSSCSTDSTKTYCRGR
jgi:hypothetical protein